MKYLTFQPIKDDAQSSISKARKISPEFSFYQSQLHPCRTSGCQPLQKRLHFPLILEMLWGMVLFLQTLLNDRLPLPHLPAHLSAPLTGTVLKFQSFLIYIAIYWPLP